MIVADDVGWGDLGSYGGAMRGAPTPNLDRLAAEGMRFVNYFGQASCTAGRASFITGRVPMRTSLSAVLAPGDPNGLTKQTPTIAQYLKRAGYNSVQLGKWFVGDKLENFPTSNGFDENPFRPPHAAKPRSKGAAYSGLTFQTCCQIEQSQGANGALPA